MRTVTMKVSPTGELFYRGYTITSTYIEWPTGGGETHWEGSTMLVNRYDVEASNLHDLLTKIDAEFER